MSKQPQQSTASGGGEENQCAKYPSNLKCSGETLSDGGEPGEQKAKHRKLQSHDTVCKSTATNVPTSFRSLPVELHRLIFYELSVEDRFFLGLTSQYFWDIARKLIGEFYASFVGTWAGESIICVGDYLDPIDLPPGMLTKNEETELQSGFDEDDYESDDSDSFWKENVGKPINLYSMAGIRYNTIGIGLGIYPTLLRAGIKYGLHKLPKVAWEVMDPKLSTFYPKSRSWVLRNLTTQEYVRSESISREEVNGDNGPHIGKPGFGEVILSRICWSARDELGNGLKHRGEWAGHRLDIVTLDRFEQEKKLGDMKWKDVSEEVASEFSKVWGSG